jgi:hypothetical protein
MVKRYPAERGERYHPIRKGVSIRPGRGPPVGDKTPRLVPGALGLHPAPGRLMVLGQRFIGSASAQS